MYLAQVKAAFAANPPGAMNKLATTMANADPSRKGPTPLINAVPIHYNMVQIVGAFHRLIRSCVLTLRKLPE
jgi:hypothetical protein